MKDNSQYGEATFLREYFEACPPKYKVLVDIGAKGIHLSNTYDLLVDGWRGLIIEPLPEHFKQVQREFSHLDVTLLNMAISDFNGIAEFFIHEVPGHSSLVRRSDKSIMVSVSKPDIIFTTHSLPYDFDLLSTDTEGNDGQIIDCILQSLYRPRIIIGEKNSGIDTDKLGEYYKEIHETKGNIVYEKR